MPISECYHLKKYNNFTESLLTLGSMLLFIYNIFIFPQFGFMVIFVYNSRLRIIFFHLFFKEII